MGFIRRTRAQLRLAQIFKKPRFFWLALGNIRILRKKAHLPRHHSVMNSLTDTDSALALLESFLAHYDQAAVAHARVELKPEQKASLDAFARGDLDKAQRKALMPLLAHNTTALEYLAELLGGIFQGKVET